MALITSSTTDTPEQVQEAIAHFGLEPEVQTVETQPAGGEQPQQQTTETKSPAPAADAEGKTQEDDASGASEEGKEEQPRDEKGRFAEKKPKEGEEGESAVPPGVQKRIDKAIAKQRAAERRVEELEAELEKLREAKPDDKNTQPAGEEGTKPAAVEPKPKVEDFESYEEYVEKLAEWTSEQKVTKLESELAELKRQLAEKEAAEARKPVEEAFARSVEEARTRYADYDDAIEAAEAEGLVIPPAMQAAIAESEVAGDLMYHLAKDPDECRRIAALSDVAAVRAIGRLEAKIEAERNKQGKPAAQQPAAAAGEPPAAQPKPKPSVSAAPPPIKPVGARSGEAAKDPSSMSTADYLRWREEDMRAKARRGY